MQCILCKGKMEQQKIDLDLRIDGKLVVVRNVSANVCQQCGEKTLSAEDASKLQKIVKKKLLSNRIKKIVVPVVELAGV